MSDLRTDMKTLMATDPNQVMQDDIRTLLETLGLPTHARNASPGLLAGAPSAERCSERAFVSAIADVAYDFANAMLKAREAR